MAGPRQCLSPVLPSTPPEPSHEKYDCRAYDHNNNDPYKSGVALGIAPPPRSGTDFVHSPRGWSVAGVESITRPLLEFSEVSTSFPLDNARVRFAGDTNIGRKRDHNEDS